MRRWVLCGCSFAAPNEGLMQTHGENMNRGMDDQRNVLHLRPAVQVRTHSHALTRLALVLRTLHSSLVRRFWLRLCSSLALFLSWSPCFCHRSTKTILPHCPLVQVVSRGNRAVGWFRRDSQWAHRMALVQIDEAGRSTKRAARTLRPARVPTRPRYAALDAST